MSCYVAGRLASGLAVVLAATFVTYAVFQLFPQDPGAAFAGTPYPTPTQVRAVDHRLGVDQSLWHQYGQFLWRVVHGNLGQTFSGQSLNRTFASTLPVTALLVLGGAILLLAVALPLAIVAARHAGTWIDRTILVVSVLGIALHPFVVAVILKDVFGAHLHLLPFGGYCPMHHVGPPKAPPGSHLTAAQLEEVAAAAHGGVSCTGAPWPWLWLQTMILPWTTFALFLLPFYVRILRTRLVETYDAPYVTVARAKGASETRILTRHLLRIVFATTLAMLALDIGVAITAAAYIETTYGLPGLGAQMIHALTPQGVGEGVYDLPTMTAIVLLVTVAVILLNLLADLVAARLDPRIRITHNPN